MQKFLDEQYDQLSPELQDTKAHTRVIDWMPMDKLELDKSIRRIRPESLPCRLHQTHCYEFVIRDWRFGSLLGRGANKDAITRIFAKAVDESDMCEMN